MNGGEPRLRGCIGTLEARRLISGFKDYALTRYFTLAFFLCASYILHTKFFQLFLSYLK